ncbi:macro domain-containing protein lmo2759-like [Anneissia japonica]|uniref:macro domain-containing protein lmo2759-like n=1 Tax=Anneissia japonica TaxID=1529436 RepID=UPI00142599F4|nr:macro domain-containing protein lmo2759-like [Anneissia japonica]XP_033126503.1 macro domain-containing protein lmo2759-like [Anneissia japonica]XP_033126504.1 macro domain-containing protein lmo2759-like [Anneissia japonica]
MEKNITVICVFAFCTLIVLFCIAFQCLPKWINRERNEIKKDVSNNEVQYGSTSYQQSLTEFTIGRGITMIIRQGDITDEDSDVIVNAANGRLQHGGGVARAIALKAGEEINVEGQQLLEDRRGGELKVSEVLHTSGYKLKAKYVVHAVGPMREREEDKNAFSHLLKKTFHNCLEYADARLKATSIAIPLISSGIYGGSKDECADALLCAVKEFSQNDSFKTVNEIRLVNIDAEATYAIIESFNRIT